MDDGLERIGDVGSPATSSLATTPRAEEITVVKRESSRTAPADVWPDLPYSAWRDTCQTVHLWTQIVGKIRLACAPWINHSWHATLYVTTRGLTTSPIPYGDQSFELWFDFHRHELQINHENGSGRIVRLEARSVADFYGEVLTRLNELGVTVQIHEVPSEIADPIPFPEDEVHASYDPEYAWRFWRVLASSARVFTDFRGEFTGKCSPVHFFWGGFDLAVTRFSGRRAPPHPGGIPNLPDWVTREAYSHEVSSAGFWPGSEAFPAAAFYSYAYPTPAGMSERAVRPRSAEWSQQLGEFVLPYEAVTTASDPDDVLRSFLTSTYDVAADLAKWDRAELEWGAEERPRPKR
jgi:hypothetical protein